MEILNKLMERFKEPSSYAGLAGLLGMFGVNTSDAVLHGIALILAGIAGIVSVFLPEQKK